MFYTLLSQKTRWIFKNLPENPRKSMYLCIFQPEFIRSLSDVLHHAGNSPVARMAAGLQLKNTLTSKDLALKEQYQKRWLAFPEDTRIYVKKNVNIKLSLPYTIYGQARKS